MVARVAQVRRVAVLRGGGLGDLVLSLPALEALRAAYPDAEVVLLAGPAHAALLAGRPSPVDRVVVVPQVDGLHGFGPPGDLDGWLAARRAEAPDVALQLHGGGGASNPLVSALGARVTVGARDAGAPPLDRTVPWSSHVHEVLRSLEVVGLVGAAPVTTVPRLGSVPGDRVAPPPGDGPLVVLHPGASDARRRWPHFAALAGALRDQGCRVAVVGAGEPSCRAVAAESGAVDLVDALALPQLLGLLAAADLVVGNDSGPRHLAAALGTPTVGVYRAAVLTVAGPSSAVGTRVAVGHRTACPVCGREQEGAPRCPHEVSFLDDVPVARVLALAEELLGERAQTGRA